jgi:DNA-binding NarL/FixJ family response regulator
MRPTDTPGVPGPVPDGRNGVATPAAASRALVSVLVINAQELFSTSLAEALEHRGFAAQPLTVTDALAIRADTPTAAAGVALLDLDLGLELGPDGHGPPLDGVELVAPLCEAGWTVLVITGITDRFRLAGAIAAGASGVVARSRPFQELLHVMQAVCAGEPVLSEQQRREWLDVHCDHHLHQHQLAARMRRLSPTDREVLRLLARGHRATAVADYFVVSLAVATAHITSILTKLEVTSQVEAVALLLAAEQR